MIERGIGRATSLSGIKATKLGKLNGGSFTKNYLSRGVMEAIA